MDFDIRKPSHIFALILLSITFLLIIVLPIFSYFDASISGEFTQISQLSEAYKLLVEVILLTVQLGLVIILLIFFPIVWYIAVNKFTLKETFRQLRLTLEGIDTAFLWGIISAIAMFAIVIVIGIIMILLGYKTDELSNIPNLEQLFSIPSLFLLVTIQPVAEEFFFRGFLLDKINILAGKNMAILVTAVLFGLAHMSYGKIYPVIMPMMMGILLGFVVIKTKNLYSAIIAHVIFNLASFILYLFAQALNLEALIL